MTQGPFDPPHETHDAPPPPPLPPGGTLPYGTYFSPEGSKSKGMAIASLVLEIGWGLWTAPRGAPGTAF